jgi:hypothetical protein
MFSACPVGMEVQRSIRQIAPTNAFRLGLKSPGERFGKGAGGASDIRTVVTLLPPPIFTRWPLVDLVWSRVARSLPSDAAELKPTCTGNVAISGSPGRKIGLKAGHDPRLKALVQIGCNPNLAKLVLHLPARLHRCSKASHIASRRAPRIHG